MLLYWDCCPKGHIAVLDPMYCIGTELLLSLVSELLQQLDPFLVQLLVMHLSNFFAWTILRHLHRIIQIIKITINAVDCNNEFMCNEIKDKLVSMISGDSTWFVSTFPIPFCLFDSLTILLLSILKWPNFLKGFEEPKL